MNTNTFDEMQDEMNRLRAENAALRSLIDHEKKDVTSPLSQPPETSTHPNISADQASNHNIRSPRLLSGMFIVLNMIVLGGLGSLYSMRAFPEKPIPLTAAITTVAFVCLVLALRKGTETEPIGKMLLGLALVFLHGSIYWLALHMPQQEYRLHIIRVLLPFSAVVCYAIPYVLGFRAAAAVASVGILVSLMDAFFIHSELIPGSYVFFGFCLALVTVFLVYARPTWRISLLVNLAIVYLLGGLLMGEAGKNGHYTYQYEMLFLLFVSTVLLKVRGARYLSRSGLPSHFEPGMLPLLTLLLLGSVFPVITSIHRTVLFSCAVLSGMSDLMAATYLCKIPLRMNWGTRLLALLGLLLTSYGVVGFFGLRYLWMVIAFESLVISGLYVYSGLPFFRTLSLFLSLTVFVGCLPEASYSGRVPLWGSFLPANWLYLGVVAFLFLSIAKLYQWSLQRASKNNSPQLETKTLPSGHGLAVLHSGLASSLLLVLFLKEFHREPNIPFLLTALGFVIFVMGFLLRSTAEKICGILVLFGAHAAFWTRVFVYSNDFTSRPQFVPESIFLCISLLWGGVFWERLLKATYQKPTFVHYTLRSLPALWVSFSAILVLRSTLGHPYAALGENLLAVGLLGFSLLAQTTGAGVAGAFAMGHGTVSYFGQMRSVAETSEELRAALFLLGAMLATYILAERLLFVASKRKPVFRDVFQPARTVLIALSGILGLFVLNEITDPKHVTLFWVAAAALILALGSIFREARYVWSGFFVLGVSGIRIIIYDLPELPLLYQIIAIGCMLLLVIGVSWKLWGKWSAPLGAVQRKNQPNDSTH